MQVTFASVLNFLFYDVLGWAIAFILGLLARKRVWRWLVSAKRYVFNSPIKVDLLATEKCQFAASTSELIELDNEHINEFKKALNDLVVKDYSRNEVWFISKSFGKIDFVFHWTEEEKESDEGEDEHPRSFIEASIKTDVPIQLKRRDLKSLGDFSLIVNELFNVYEKFYTPPLRPHDDRFIIADIVREVPFVDQKRFSRIDADTNAKVNATEEMITITSPVNSLRRAVEKYHFI